MNRRAMLPATIIAFALAVAAVGAEARGGGGGAPGGGGGGASPGGGWQGGGGGQGGGSWHGGGNWHGGGGGQGGGGWHGGGNWQGGNPGHWGGGWNRGWYGGPYRGWYGGWYPGWYGGWWGPGLALSFGLPAYWGWPLYDYAWSAPSPVYVPDAAIGSFAPVPSTPAPVSYWYYCTEPAGYYPYVPSCGKAWIPVTPSIGMPAPSTPAQQ